MGRLARQSIPCFSLYGERRLALTDADVVHIEDIPSRSRKYLWQIESHRHEKLCQLIFVTSGPAFASIEDSNSTVEGPIAFLVPAGTIHSFRFRAETRGYVLTLMLSQLSVLVATEYRARIESLFKLPRTVALNASVAGRTENLLECLLTEHRRSHRLPDSVAMWLACCALCSVADGSPVAANCELHGSEDLRRLDAFRSLIDAHHAEHWPVARYAMQLQMSEAGLNRLSRRLIGCTGFDLIQQRIMLEARRRLMSLGNSVSQVAGTLGFSDSAYFSRFFRRHSGMSPLAFRRSQIDGKVPARVHIVQ